MYWTPGFPICIQLKSEKYLWTIYRKVLFKVSDVSSLDHVIIMAHHWHKITNQALLKNKKKEQKASIMQLCVLTKRKCTARILRFEKLNWAY